MTNKIKTSDALEAAGGKSSVLARLCGVTRQAVDQWSEHVPRAHIDTCRELIVRYKAELRAKLRRMKV